MKGCFIGFCLGIILVVFAIWHFSRKNEHVALVRKDLEVAAHQAGDYVKEKIGTTNLSKEDILDELKRTGHIVRIKADKLGAEIAEETADPRKVAVIKAKLLADQSLASLDISVHCNKGEVTLSGTSTTPENISSAIKIALGVEGVTKVVSTLTVKPATK